MSRAMDNFQFTVRSYGDEDLRAALDFIMGSKTWPQTATHWCVMPGPTADDEPRDHLVLFWSDPSKAGNKDNVAFHAFPAPLTNESAFQVIREWLEQVGRGHEPDLDGSVSKGFEIQSPDMDFWFGGYALLTVTPEWAHHHK